MSYVLHLVTDCIAILIFKIHELGNRDLVSRHHKAEQTDETME